MKKKIEIYIGILLLLLCGICASGKDAFVTARDGRQEEAAYTNDYGGVGTGDLLPGTVVTQTVWVTDYDLTKIAVRFATMGRINRGQLEVSLENRTTGEILGNWTVNTEELVDYGYKEFEIDADKTQLSLENELAISVSCKEASDGEYVTIVRSQNDVLQGELTVNGNEMSGDMSLRLYNRIHFGFLKKIYFVLASILYLITALALYIIMFRSGRISIKYYFLIFAGVLGMVYLFILPPFSSPDELCHFGRAYSWANYLTGKEPVQGTFAEFLTEEERASLIKATDKPSLATYAKMYGGYGQTPLKVEENSFHELQGAEIEYRPTNTPFSYAPQILAIMIGKCIGLSFWKVVYLARLLNFFVYTLLIFAAVCIMPKYRILMICIALWPMTLEQLASCSYDSMILGLAFLFIANWLRLMEKKSLYTVWDLAAEIMLVFLIASCKPFYAPLILLCAALPKENFRKGWRKGFWISFLLPVILGILYFEREVIKDVLTGSNVAWGDPEMEGMTIQDVVLHPLRIMKMFFNTLLRNGQWYLYSAVGSELGWLEIRPSAALIMGFIGTTVLSVIPAENETEKNFNKERMISLEVFVLSVFCIIGTLLLSSTYKASEIIGGVQGRYFIPVLPLLCIALRGKRIRIEKNIDEKLVCSMWILNFLVLIDVFRIISVR